MLPYLQKIERWTTPRDRNERDTTSQYIPEVHTIRDITSVSVAGHKSAIDEMALKTSGELGAEYAFNVDMNAGDPHGTGECSAI